MQPLDGLSMLPAMTGQSMSTRDLYWHFPGYLGAGQGTWRTTPAGAVRSGNFKLIEFFEDGRQELYDLQADLSQKTNLLKTQPGKAAELHAKLVAWRKAVNAPMPTKNTK
jgi:arylsulfatase A-like enzyme